MNTDSAQNSDKAVVILVLGVVSLLIIQILGPVPWIMGNRALKSMGPDAPRRGFVVAGRIMGMIATAFFVLTIIWFVLLLLIPGLVSGFS